MRWRKPMPDAMSLRTAARNLLWLRRECPDLFDHVPPISEEDLVTLEEIAASEDDEHE
jgi:hypothetical protein